MKNSIKNYGCCGLIASGINKRLVVLAFFLGLPLFGLAQKETAFYATLNQKGYTKAEWSFISQMKVAAKALDACSINKGCNWGDPHENLRVKVEEQITLGLNSNADTQKKMAKFEKELMKNKKITKQQIESAFAKNPGYSFPAMSARMTFYIRTMESVDDDE